MSTKPLNPRNAREPSGDSGPFYVLAEGAPQHYVDGYGLCNAGAIVTLAPGIDPGKWYVEVAQEDAEKAMGSESDAQRLAAMAAAKIKAGGNANDRKRKQVADETIQLQRIAEEQARAQAEADGIARVAQADAKVKVATDEAAAAKAYADDLKAQLDAANNALADAQTQVASLQGAEQAKQSGGDEKKDGKAGGNK